MFSRVPDTPMSYAAASVCSNYSAGKRLLKINNKSNFEKNFLIAFIINFGNVLMSWVWYHQLKFSCDSDVKWSSLCESYGQKLKNRLRKNFLLYFERLFFCN